MAKTTVKVTKQRLLQLSKTYANAYVAQDVATLSELLADEWTVVPAGCSDPEPKKKQLQDLKTGKLRVKSIKDKEVEVLVYDKTAIVRGVRKSVVFYNNRDVSDLSRFIQVYVEKEEGWKCVATQVTSFMPKTSEKGHKVSRRVS
jgi:hypothetical protein